MTTALVPSVNVTAEEKRELDDIALDLMSARKSVAANILIMGKGLQRAHEICSRDGEIGFRAYLKSVDISKTWAYAAIKAFEKFGECPTVGHMEARTVFLLTCDYVPDETREEVLDAIEAGETVTAEQVKEKVDKHKPAKKDRATATAPPEKTRDVPKKKARTTATLAEGCEPEAIHEGEQAFTPAEPEPYRCQHCGHDECDDEGDCLNCKDPPPDKPSEPAPRKAEPNRPFATMPELCADVDDAFQSYKLCILRHKLAGWREISRGDLIESLKSLIELAKAPAE